MKIIITDENQDETGLRVETPEEYLVSIINFNGGLTTKVYVKHDEIDELIKALEEVKS